MRDSEILTKALIGVVLTVQIVSTCMRGSSHACAPQVKVRLLPSCQAGIPEILSGAPFHEDLGCWHVQRDPEAAKSRLHVAAELNFAPGQRWQEVLQAFNATKRGNPQVHYILTTSSTVSLDNMQRSPELAQLPHDIWYCPEVLYGTPVAIANRYPGTKIACSADNWIPEMSLKCNFTQAGRPVVFVVQRRESKELSGKDVSCEAYRDLGSADGIMFEYIPEDAIRYLKFPRTYWGCENLALYVLQRAGLKLVNLCPAFGPTHMHKIQDRDPGRLRINHPANSVSAGERTDINRYCSQTT